MSPLGEGGTMIKEVGSQKLMKDEITETEQTATPIAQSDEELIRIWKRKQRDQDDDENA
jgi:hypothetical protein